VCSAAFILSSLNVFASILDHILSSHKSGVQAYCSLSVFMLGYHVHEKAIMSTIIPLTVLSLESIDHARLYIRVCAFGHLGLLPLLFRPVESLFKISSYVVHLSLSVLLLDFFHSENGKIIDKPMRASREQPGLLTNIDKFYLFLILCLILCTEVFHNMSINPVRHLEFLPLMSISVFCAVGLLFCWISLTKIMWKYSFQK
jgi:alpha-1,3-glucosyltransferase